MFLTLIHGLVWGFGFAVGVMLILFMLFMETVISDRRKAARAKEGLDAFKTGLAIGAGPESGESLMTDSVKHDLEKNYVGKIFDGPPAIFQGKKKVN